MNASKTASSLLSGVRFVAAIALLAYPVIVWLGLSGLGDSGPGGGSSPRVIAAVLLAIVAPAAFLRLRRSGRNAVRGLAAVPLITVVALTAATVLDAAGFMLAVPVAISAVLLLAFGATLRAGSTPMIERFARLQKADLSPDELLWCRLWTRIWCAFFVVNGGLALALAVLAPIDWWAFYNGLVAYALIGTLLASEWLLRRRRFPTALPGEDRT